MDALLAWWRVNVSHRRDLNVIQSATRSCGIPLELFGHVTPESALGHLVDLGRQLALPLCASGVVGGAIVQAPSLLALARAITPPM